MKAVRLTYQPTDFGDNHVAAEAYIRLTELGPGEPEQVISVYNRFSDKVTVEFQYPNERLSPFESRLRTILMGVDYVELDILGNVSNGGRK